MMDLPDDPDAAVRQFRRQLAAADREEARYRMVAGIEYRNQPPVTRGEVILHSTGFLPIPKTQAPGYDDEPISTPVTGPDIIYPPPTQNPDFPDDSSVVPARYLETDLPDSLQVISLIDGTILDTIAPTYDGVYGMRGARYYISSELDHGDWLGNLNAAGVEELTANAYGLVAFPFSTVEGEQYYLRDFFHYTYTVSGIVVTRTNFGTWQGGDRTLRYNVAICKWTLDGVVKTPPQSSPAGTYGSEVVS